MKEVSPVRKPKGTTKKCAFYVSIWKWEHENMKTKIIFALLTEEVDGFKEKDKEYLIEVCNILDDFSYLWPIELPNQFPLMLEYNLLQVCWWHIIVLRTINLVYKIGKSFEVWYLSCMKLKNFKRSWEPILSW